MSDKSKNTSIIILLGIFVYFLFGSLFKTSKSKRIEIAIITPKQKWLFNLLIITLFITGLVISFFALLIDKADKNQTLIQIFAPKSVTARKGLNKLSVKRKISGFEQEQLRLSPDDSEFSELADIGQKFINDFLEAKFNINKRLILVTEIAAGAGIEAADFNNPLSIRYFFQINNRIESLEFPSEKIEEEITNRRDTVLFYWAVFFFFIGVIIQIFSFWINSQFSQYQVSINEIILNDKINEFIKDKLKE